MTREELTREEQIVLDALRSVSGSDREAAAEMFNDILSGKRGYEVTKCLEFTRCMKH